MRATFSDELVRLAIADPRVLLLTGDHGYALFDAFRKECPGQYINCGIAEQNMVGVAAGLAKAGFRPIVYGLAAFIPIRVLEQIKIDVCYENLPVTFVGDGAGIVYAQLGASHQSTEDISALRAVPAIEIFAPADKYELKSVMERVAHSRSPLYLRFGKADLGDVHERNLNSDALPYPLPVLKSPVQRKLYLATGSMVRPALELANQQSNASVYSIPCLKPFPAEAVRDLVAKYREIVVFEEHSRYGGLGSAVAESIVGRFVGDFRICAIDDRFSKTCGNYQHLMSEHGLDEAGLWTRLAATKAVS